MAKYRAAMNVFGLRRGEEFDSDEPEWAKHAAAGLLVDVTPADEGSDVLLTALNGAGGQAGQGQAATGPSEPSEPPAEGADS